MANPARQMNDAATADGHVGNHGFAANDPRYHDGKKHKSGLDKAFNVAAKGAGFALKGVAFYFGFFALDSFLDYGLIHSTGWANSPLAGMSIEALKPLSDALPTFFSEGIGSDIINIMTEAIKSIHEFFGVHDTFGMTDPLSDAVGDLDRVVDIMPDSTAPCANIPEDTMEYLECLENDL